MNKKLIGLALLLTLAVGLGACDQGGTPEGGEASPSPAESASPSPTGT